MKKKLIFSSILFLMLGGIANAQVGINNTSPKATLDVVGDKANATIPDGILVPRLSAAELLAKDNVYLGPQDGALVYVTTGIGNTTKTSNVDGAGLYYYNNTIGKWIKATGSSSVPVATPMNVITVTVDQGYDALATDDIILLNVTTSGRKLKLPTSGIEIGKRYYVNNAGLNIIDLDPAPIGTANVHIPAQQGAMLIFAGSAGWIYLTGY